MPRGKIYRDISFTLGKDEEMLDGSYKLRLKKTCFVLTIPYRVGIKMVAFPENLRRRGIVANYSTDFSDEPNDSRSRFRVVGGGMDEKDAKEVASDYVRQNFDGKHCLKIHEHRTPVEVRILHLKPKVLRKPWKKDGHAPLNALYAEGVVYCRAADI